MRVLSLVHQSDAGSGVLGDEVRARGHELEEWIPAAAALPRALRDYDALIAFGGGMQPDEEDRHPWLRSVHRVLEQALADRLPTLGVCLGAQLLARVGGGQVGPAPRAEWGWNAAALTAEASSDPLFAGLPPVIEVFQWHSYCFTLPPGGVALAESPVCLQAFRIGPAAWGVQWHPEITAETALLWAERYPPRPRGVPVPVDVGALREVIARRIDVTNADGRRLCARFLGVAAQQRSVAA